MKESHWGPQVPVWQPPHRPFRRFSAAPSLFRSFGPTLLLSHTHPDYYLLQLLHAKINAGVYLTEAHTYNIYIALRAELCF